MNEPFRIRGPPTPEGAPVNGYSLVRPDSGGEAAAGGCIWLL